MTQNMKKAELMPFFFVLVFTGKVISQDFVYLCLVKKLYERGSSRVRQSSYGPLK